MHKNALNLRQKKTLKNLGYAAGLTD